MTEFSLPANIPSYKDVKDILDKTVTYCFTDFFNQNQVKQIVDAFYKAESDWVKGFGLDEDDGIDYTQFGLGEVWYYYAEGHVPTNNYFKNAAKARESVERHIPGLEAYVLDFLRKFYETDKVEVRKGWAGPGIVSFPVGNGCSRQGGPIHFDVEGLPGVDLSKPEDIETFSFVSMLEKPVSGGDLLVWDIPYDHKIPSHRKNDLDPDEFPVSDAVKVDYKLTELWMFNGLRPHGIQAFEGDKDRICLTFHTARKGDGWECWL